MTDIEQILRKWKKLLCPQISMVGHYARNPTAHKWKATYRSLLLRESVFWRTHDLLTQADLLHQANHVLGSRILIRSALESVATLVYLNQLTSNVLDESLDFHAFDAKTRKLVIGSRNRSTKHESISIVTVLDKCEKKYEGVAKVYADLCECAHPNFEGMCFGYSTVDYERDEANFSNKWSVMWSDRHEPLVKLVCTIFEEEYNNVWVRQLEKLEIWLTANDSKLEATKGEGT